MRRRIRRLDLSGFLQCVGRFVVSLQTAVRVAEILVSVRANLVSLLEAEFVSTAGFAQQLNRLHTRVDCFLVTVGMVVSKTEIVVDLRTRRVELQRLVINVN